MPTPVPVADGGSSEDGAQPFSEVLSLSSPDRPGSSDSSPSQSSASPDEAHNETSSEPTKVPEAPAADRAGSPGERTQGSAGPFERGHGPARRAVGSTPPSRVETTDQLSVPGSTETQGDDVAAGMDQTLGATNPLALSATLVPPGASVASPASDGPATSPASDGPAASADHSQVAGGDGVLSTVPIAQDGSDASTVVSLVAQLPQTPGAGPSDDGPRRNQASTDLSEGGTEVRGSVEREAAPGSALLRSGPVRVLVDGATPVAAASALSGATTGTSGVTAVAAEESLDPAEFPDGGGGTAGVDISDLAASISRPLAGGSGDYSVQVSLHPPELGEVRALLSLQGDVLHVTLTPEHSTGFDALSDAMPALHEQLAGGGVEVHVTLGHPGDPEGGNGRGAAESGQAAKESSDDTSPIIPVSMVPTNSGGPGRIHLVL
jgi:Flagellar hook-length control protein FliK